MTWVPRLAALPEPPLTPSADDARSALRRELLHPDYHRDNLLQRLVDWLQRVLDRGLDAARGAPPLTTFAAMVVALLLLVAVVWLVGRARRTPHALRSAGSVLTGESVTAAELRTRAEHARHEERFGDAVVDGFRALALRQVERDRIEDLPGATAREVAAALAEVFPAAADDVRRSAGLFDLVLYGGRPATRAQATEVLELDDRLASILEPAGARS